MDPDELCPLIFGANSYGSHRQGSRTVHRSSYRRQVIVFHSLKMIFETTVLRGDLRQGNGADSEIQKAFIKATKLAYKKDQVGKNEGQNNLPLILLVTPTPGDQETQG